MPAAFRLSLWRGYPLASKGAYWADFASDSIATACRSQLSKGPVPAVPEELGKMADFA